jgi:hypothetical protein
LLDAVKDAEDVKVGEDVLDLVEDDDPVIVGVVVPDRDGEPELVEDLLEDPVFGAVGEVVVLAVFVEEPDVVRVASCVCVPFDDALVVCVELIDRDGDDVVVGDRVRVAVKVCSSDGLDVAV